VRRHAARADVRAAGGPRCRHGHLSVFRRHPPGGGAVAASRAWRLPNPVLPANRGLISGANRGLAPHTRRPPSPRGAQRAWSPVLRGWGRRSAGRLPGRLARYSSSIPRQARRSSIPTPSHSFAPSGPAACALPPTVFWNGRSHVPSSVVPATSRRLMKPPSTRPEFGLNGSDPKSGSPPEVTSNVSVAADPAPTGLLGSPLRRRAGGRAPPPSYGSARRARPRHPPARRRRVVRSGRAPFTQFTAQSANFVFTRARVVGQFESRRSLRASKRDSPRQDLRAAWGSTIDRWPPALFVISTRRGFAASATGILSVSTPWS
jgi:hypothetical protein